MFQRGPNLIQQKTEYLLQGFFFVIKEAMKMETYTHTQKRLSNIVEFRN